MAILKIAPNGQQVSFPDGTSDKAIQEILSQDRFQPVDQPKQTNTPVTPTSNAKRSVVSDIGTQALGGAFDAVNSGIGLIEKIGDTLGEKTNIGGFVFGDDAENGVMQYKSYEELKADGNEDILFGKYNEDDAGQLTEIDEADTVAGSITRGITQFTTGYLFGNRILGAIQPISTAGKVAKTMGVGAVADFTAFNEETGRLVDIINEVAPDLQNPLFDYLSSDPEDTWYEARFKNALEGTLVGGALEATFRTFRLIKNKNAKQNGNKYSKEEISEDEKYLRELEEKNLKNENPNAVDVTTIKQTAEDKKLFEQAQKNSEKELEDSVFEQFQTYQKTAKNRKEFDDGLFELNLNLGFNARQFNNLEKGGLLELDAFEKAFNNVVKKRKVIITDEQIANSAKRLYQNDVGKLDIDIRELEKVVKNAPQKVVALNSYIETLANGINRVSKNKNSPEAEALVFKVLLPKLKVAENQKTNIGEGLARGLRNFGNVPEGGVKQKISEIIKEFDAYGGSKADFLNKLSKAENVDVSKVLSYVTKNKSWNVVNEVWINALLSNPKTHIINISSNIANTIIKPFEQFIGSQLTFGTSNKAKSIRAESKRALRTYIGFREYLYDSIKYAGKAFKKEDTIIGGKGGLTKLDTPVRSLGGIAGKLVRIPTRLLNTADEFFKQINYRSKLKADAVMKAIELGKDPKKIVGSTLKKRPISEFDAYVLEYIRKGFDENGLVGIDPSAMRYAQESTYTQDLTGIFKRMQDIVNEYPVLRQIVPFVRTPVNLMLNIVDRTPLGLIRKQYLDDFLGKNSPEATAKARGQIALGTSLMTYASMLYKEGYIVGVQGTGIEEKTTKSKDLAELRKSSGALPYAFRYWNEESESFKFVQFGRADPFGAFFGIVADYNEVYSRLTEEELKRVGGDILLMLAQQGGDVGDFISPTTKITNVAKASWAGITRNLFSKTYLKGLADFMQVITEDNPNQLQRYINSKVGSFIPNIYTKLINDPFYRDVRSILDEVKKRTGAEEVELKYDFRGQPLQIQGDETDRLINGMFNPFSYSEQKQDPVTSEILSLGVNIPKMNEKFKGSIDLNLFVNKKGQTGYNRLQEILRQTKIGGKDLNSALETLITSSYYKNLSEPTVIDDLVKDDGGKVKEIKKLVKRYQNIAETLLFKEANQFISTKDKRGKFTLMDSYKNAEINKAKIGSGIKVRDNDYFNSLYQFTNDL